ncbi:MAG: hypothetical protein HRT88_09070 [Lentisphaeraceae bacterium]|nr:hypothetical protein [Lentisphaeraceae bacterium]
MLGFLAIVLGGVFFCFYGKPNTTSTLDRRIIEVARASLDKTVTNAQIKKLQEVFFYSKDEKERQ